MECLWSNLKNIGQKSPHLAIILQAISSMRKTKSSWFELKEVAGNKLDNAYIIHGVLLGLVIPIPVLRKEEYIKMALVSNVYCLEVSIPKGLLVIKEMYTCGKLGA